jgi:hypothetical protein
MNASVISNTNRVVFSSDVDLNNIQTFGFIYFPPDRFFNSIIRKNKFIFNKQFQVISESQIRLNLSDEDAINLMVGDEIRMILPAYNLLGLFGINDGGKDYKENDVIEIEGLVVISKDTNQPDYAKFLVSEVNVNGSINKLSVLENGRYIKVPENNIIVSGGSGSGCNLHVEFNPKPIIYSTENIIKDYKLFDKNLHDFWLEFPIQSGFNIGTLTVQKWDAFIDCNYAGLNKIGKPFILHQHFTPQLHLPMLLKDGINTDLIINQIILRLENKIIALEDRLNKLTS